jgi:hypothetical protein
VSKWRTLPPVGTIVRLLDQEPHVLAVVVPMEFGPVYNLTFKDIAFTRILIGPLKERSAANPEAHGGWYIGPDGERNYEVVPDDQVPDEILALAGCCLLDPNFVPRL